MSLGQFKGFVLASKLDNRQTLLQINSFSSEYREQIVSKFHAIAKSIKTMELDPLPRKLRIFHLEKKKTRRHLMDKCTIRKKELPEGTKAPVCEYHRAQSKKKRAGYRRNRRCDHHYCCCKASAQCPKPFPPLRRRRQKLQKNDQRCSKRE